MPSLPISASVVGKGPTMSSPESASRPLVDFGELNGKAIKGLTYLSKIIWLTWKKTINCVILMNNDKCQATNEDKYWRYFGKVNSLSPRNMLA
jgi:hypothetical protein